MGDKMFKPGLESSKGTERGARHKPADTEGTKTAVRALSGGYIAAMKASPDLDSEDAPVLWWLCDLVAEAFAEKIPDSADGQQVLDGVVNALRKRESKGMASLGIDIDIVFLGRVVQALYLAGHNNLLLDLIEPIGDTDELSYLEGTPDEKLVLYAQGAFDAFKMIRNCHISFSGDVREIDYCTDSRFDIRGKKMPWIKNDTRGCVFYFHDMDKESIQIKKQSLHNAYFVRNDNGEWERVEFQAEEQDVS